MMSRKAFLTCLLLISAGFLVQLPNNLRYFTPHPQSAFTVLVKTSHSTLLLDPKTCALWVDLGDGPRPQHNRMYLDQQLYYRPCKDAL